MNKGRFWACVCYQCHAVKLAAFRPRAKGNAGGRAFGAICEIVAGHFLGEGLTLGAILGASVGHAQRIAKGADIFGRVKGRAVRIHKRPHAANAFPDIQNLGVRSRHYAIDPQFRHYRKIADQNIAGGLNPRPAARFNLLGVSLQLPQPLSLLNVGEVITSAILANLRSERAKGSQNFFIEIFHRGEEARI